MWSPNELLKIEKQRDILSYITLQFFHFKKVPLEHCPFAAGIFIEKGKSNSCHAGLPGGFGDGLGHGGAYPLVEGGGDDVVRAELLGGD